MKARVFSGFPAPWLLLFSAAMVGCSSCRGPEASPEGGPSSDASLDASAVRSLDSGADAAGRADAAAPKRARCKVVLPPLVVDKGVRADTGVSLTTWERTVLASAPTDRGDAHDAHDANDANDTKPRASADAGDESSKGESGPRAVLGYAKAHGAPHVAEVDERGRIFHPKVPSKLETLDRKPEPDVKRVVHRVVPRMPHADEAWVSVDYSETGPDKTRHVHCGAAEAGPYVAFDGPAITLGSEAESETLECRTVLGKSKTEHVALESQLSFDGRSVDASLRFGGKTIASHRTSLKSGEKPSERFGYSSLGLGTTGEVYVVTARVEGSVALVLGRTSTGEHRDEVFTLASPSNAPTAVAIGAGYTVFGSLQGKPTVYGVRLPFDEKTGRFEKVAKPWTWPATPDDPDERSFVSAVVTGKSTWLLVGEKLGSRRTGKLYAVDESQAGGALAFVPFENDESVLDAKVVLTARNELFVAYVTLDETRVATLKATVLACE
jgi:hypothetical protein